MVMENPEDITKLAQLQKEIKVHSQQVEKSKALYKHLFALKAMGVSGIVYLEEKPYSF